MDTLFLPESFDQNVAAEQQREPGPNKEDTADVRMPDGQGISYLKVSSFGA
jgi:hypothetical protein